MRSLWIGMAAILWLAVCGPAWAQGSFEANVDRQGGDYHTFDIRGGAGACQSACASDRRCAAWTFVQPGVQGASQRCWLKSSVPPPRGDSCCVSGVMRSGAVGATRPAGTGEGDCCPNNMLVCPAGRHFCTTPSADAAAARRQPYNPAWQAAPGDTSCCPNNMLVCPTPRHFCSR